MASSKVKFRLCLLGLTLFLACVSVGLGTESESLGSESDDGCVNRCEGLKGNNADEFAACEKLCGVNGRLSPQPEYQACRLRCQVVEPGVEQQRRCQQRCEERLREREQSEGRGKDEDERRDPEREREEQRRREHEREERRRREHEREHKRGQGRLDKNERDPECKRAERCKQERRREEEQERREQERREQERRSENDEEDEKRRDPDWRKEQERREREWKREHGKKGVRDENERDPDWRKEQERREQEWKREHGKKGGRDENKRDPEDWRKEQERREEEWKREHGKRGSRDENPDWRREQERREEEWKREHGKKGGRDENKRDPEDWRKEQERREEEWKREHGKRGSRDENPDWRREQERREEEWKREHGKKGGRDENKRDPEDWRKEQERREEEWKREHGKRGSRDENPDWRREQERREEEWKREHGKRGSRDENPDWRREQERREEEWKREHGKRGGRANQVEIRRTEQEHSRNPYYFQEQQFQSRFRSGEGHWRVLEKFSERSELLKGIKNQRLAILEARPQTFIVPHHLDAESLLLVVRGKATITTVVQEKRETKKESYNVECGDVMMVPAGTTIYLANHENEDLQIVNLIQPVNNPGEFEDYLSGGGEAQAYYSVFSNDVLEAALNIPRDRLERIFKQKGERRGKIIKASQEQLRALSQGATSVRKGSRGTRAPIKLQSQTPVYSNQFGKMFEACPDEFPQLQRTNVAAAVVDIKQGGMMVPHFNSRATWVVFVSEGNGQFEMACPHVQGGQWQRGRREEERHDEREGRSGQIERVSGRLSQGGVLVIPAGHPIAIMASPNENLRLVGFGINAENNRRNFLAGKKNIMNEVDREAKELAFNVEGKQADEIFRSQKESFFTEGPKEGHRKSSERSPLMSVLNI